MFFVLGLPRSRTFWLSQFLGCVHEASYYYPNYPDFLRTKHKGDSTTCYPLIKDYVKKSHKVIIHRDEGEVQGSLKKLFDKEIDLSPWDSLYEEEGLHVHFDEINDKLPEIWAYCHAEELPKERLSMKNKVLNNEFLIQEVQKCL